jgi:hypothetical protein
MKRFAAWPLVAALAATGCHTVKPLTLDELAARSPGRVWVTRADQSVVVVESPRLSNDRLLGFVDGKYQAIPAADVKQVRLRERATGRTAALLAAGAFGAFAVAAMLSGSTEYHDPCSRASSECIPGDQP